MADTLAAMKFLKKPEYVFDGQDVFVPVQGSKDLGHKGKVVMACGDLCRVLIDGATRETWVSVDTLRIQEDT